MQRISNELGIQIPETVADVMRVSVKVRGLDDVLDILPQVQNVRSRFGPGFNFKAKVFLPIYHQKVRRNRMARSWILLAM